MKDIKQITLDGIVYVPKERREVEVSKESLQVVIIRTCSAGVFYGYLKEKRSTLAGIEVDLLHAKRIRNWKGALSISELAMKGTTNPAGCVFCTPVNEIYLTSIEIIPVTKEAFNSLESVKI